MDLISEFRSGSREIDFRSGSVQVAAIARSELEHYLLPIILKIKSVQGENTRVFSCFRILGRTDSIANIQLNTILENDSDEFDHLGILSYIKQVSEQSEDTVFSIYRYECLILNKIIRSGWNFQSK